MSQEQNSEELESQESAEAEAAEVIEAAEEHAGADEHDVADEGLEPALDLALVKQVVETALLTSPEPLSLNELKRMFPRGHTNNDLMRKLLDEIRAEWQGRGVELANVASGWRFRAKPELQRFLDKLNPQKPPKYSRAVMETLAIIAYRQPVTRGDVEDIRGVVVSSNIIRALEARGWIEAVGFREVPGRPALYATTKQFLDDLNLLSLEELPPLDDLGALVESSGAAQVELNMPGQGGATFAGEGFVDDDPEDEIDSDAAAPPQIH